MLSTQNVLGGLGTEAAYVSNIEEMDCSDNLSVQRVTESSESDSEDELIDVGTNVVMEETDEPTVVEEVEIPITPVSPVRRMGMIEANDMSFKYDLNPQESVAVESVDGYVVWNEWKNEHLLIYINRQKEAYAYGMFSIRMTNRKNNDKTIGQVLVNFYADQQTASIEFANARGFFLYKIQIEIRFEHLSPDNTFIYYPTHYKDGSLLLREDEITDLNLGQINWSTMECQVDQNLKAADCYEYYKARKDCELFGFSDDILVKCHNLSSQFNMSFLKLSQDEILKAPLTVLEFFIIAEVFGLDQVMYETMSKMDSPEKIKYMAQYASFLGPKAIRLLLEKFSSMNSKHIESDFKCLDFAPKEETSIMKAIQPIWPPKTNIKSNTLQSAVAAAQRYPPRIYNRLVSEDGKLHLKLHPLLNRTSTKKRPELNTLQSPQIMTNNSFDVLLENENVIKFTIQCKYPRISTLWHIDANIIILLRKRNRNNDIIWKYDTRHQFSWNSKSCTVIATTMETVQKNYPGAIAYEVQIHILENEGFVNVDTHDDRYNVGATTFTVDGSHHKVTVLNKGASFQSEVFRILINDAKETAKNRRKGHLPGVTFTTLKRILDSIDENKNILESIDYTHEDNFDIPVAARILQHHTALRTILATLKEYNVTHRFMLAELFAYDDLQMWCMDQIETIEDFREIDLSMLQDRSIAAIFSALCNL